KGADEGWVSIGRGALLRMHIPEILGQEGIKDEKFIYTDCDVLFLQNVEPLDNMWPKVLAACPEHDPLDWSYFNSGVLLMQRQALEETYEQFCAFFRERYNTSWAFDQDAYNIFYQKDWQKLPQEYNWKPYWGHNPQARIVHFHGLKPTRLAQVQAGKQGGIAGQFICEAYRFYAQWWFMCLQEVDKKLYATFEPLPQKEAFDFSESSVDDARLEEVGRGLMDILVKALKEHAQTIEILARGLKEGDDRGIKEAFETTQESRMLVIHGRKLAARALHHLGMSDAQKQESAPYAQRIGEVEEQYADWLKSKESS
ncbi:MAG: glycosyltransferase, partial [Myxococcota bacterium]|nr:glycosyltransferase [Myxococcota bacterium]